MDHANLLYQASEQLQCQEQEEGSQYRMSLVPAYQVVHPLSDKKNPPQCGNAGYAPGEEQDRKSRTRTRAAKKQTLDQVGPKSTPKNLSFTMGHIASNGPGPVVQYSHPSRQEPVYITSNGPGPGVQFSHPSREEPVSDSHFSSRSQQG